MQLNILSVFVGKMLLKNDFMSVLFSNVFQLCFVPNAKIV